MKTKYIYKKFDNSIVRVIIEYIERNKIYIPQLNGLAWKEAFDDNTFNRWTDNLNGLLCFFPDIDIICDLPDDVIKISDLVVGEWYEVDFDGPKQLVHYNGEGLGYFFKARNGISEYFSKRIKYLPICRPLSPQLKSYYKLQDIQ